MPFCGGAAFAEVSEGAFDGNAGVEETKNGEEAVADIAAVGSVRDSMNSLRR